jgi:uncharacterized protein YodC (DUF2158 family)
MWKVSDFECSFKVGDKVKIKDPRKPTFYEKQVFSSVIRPEIYRQGEVTEVIPRKVTVVFSCCSWYFLPSELELVKVPAKFKVGDEVKPKNPGSSSKYGEIYRDWKGKGKVREVYSPSKVSVTFKDKTGEWQWDCAVDELELVKVPTPPKVKENKVIFKGFDNDTFEAKVVTENHMGFGHDHLGIYHEGKLLYWIHLGCHALNHDIVVKRI